MRRKFTQGFLGLRLAAGQIGVALGRGVDPTFTEDIPMLVRISGGMVRYGLPGLIVGVALSWLAGISGRGGSPGRGQRRSGNPDVPDAGRRR